MGAAALLIWVLSNLHPAPSLLDDECVFWSLARRVATALEDQAGDAQLHVRDGSVTVF